MAIATTNAVSKLEVDNAVGAWHAAQATVEANRATVRQLEQQQRFAQIRAPFAGVITQRNTDVGDLVNAGSSTTPGTALFQIAKTDKLRVYVRVPEPFAPAIRPSLSATLSVAGFPNQTFSGTLVRTASAIDPATRTLLAEISVDNPTGTLFSGAYAEVKLQLPTRHDVFVLPVETLLFRREGLQVATVRDNRIVMKKIVPGRDFGDRIEVVQGIDATDRVIHNPGDAMSDGDPVRVTQVEQRATQQAER
jgi:RND family efflux transporter MFP subunit